MLKRILRGLLLSRKGRILLLVLIITGCMGAAAWRLGGDSNDTKTPGATQARIKCISDDKRLCKFITSWTPATEYRSVFRDTTDGAENTVTYEYDLSETDKIHTLSEGTNPYESITIGNAVYIKAGDTWWKRTVDVTSAKQTNKKPKSPNQEYEPLKPDHYSFVKQEDCGELVCYKYSVNDPASPELKQYIWFDNQQYRLRKTNFATPENSGEQTFDYTDVDITEPSPVRKLAPNQTIKPGDPGPTES